jgi:exopolyphosphatase/pppGpp-phosphohydrolase
VIPHTVNPWAEIPVAEYLKLHDRLIVSTHAERAAIKGSNPSGRSLIVVASLFTHFVLRELRIGSMYQSSYALKEGFFAELIGNKPSGMEPTRKTDGRKFV